MKKIAAILEVDHIQFKTAQLYDFSNKADLLPEDPSLSRYQVQEKGMLTIKNSLSNHCWRMWSSSVITWDGRIVPCCFDKDATHQMGMLDELSFERIWNGEKYNRFRQQILTSRREIGICSNCTEGTKTWV
jgi:radical SAM protein with 4Fe4S-binding SPASM domain